LRLLWSTVHTWKTSCALQSLPLDCDRCTSNRRDETSNPVYTANSSSEKSLCSSKQGRCIAGIDSDPARAPANTPRTGTRSMDRRSADCTACKTVERGDQKRDEWTGSKVGVWRA
jgi:hypothetical protein